MDNILYVTVRGDDNNGEIGNPLRPFTLVGAINRINSLNTAALMIINLGIGEYISNCPNIIPITSNIQIIGRGVKQSIITVYQFDIDNAASITFQNLTIRSCQSVVLFNLINGTPTINNSLVEVRSGTFVREQNGTILINESSVVITAAVTNPVIDLTGGGMIANNSKFLFSYNPTNAVLLGSRPGNGVAAGSLGSWGATILNNVIVLLRFPSSTGKIIPFYNVHIIDGGSLTITTGETSNTEIIILGYDIIPNDVNTTVQYVQNFNVSTEPDVSRLPRGPAPLKAPYRLYQIYNVYNIPVIINNFSYTGPIIPQPYTSQEINPPNYITNQQQPISVVPQAVQINTSPPIVAQQLNGQFNGQSPVGVQQFNGQSPVGAQQFNGQFNAQSPVGTQQFNAQSPVGTQQFNGQSPVSFLQTGLANQPAYSQNGLANQQGYSQPANYDEEYNGETKIYTDSLRDQASESVRTQYSWGDTELSLDRPEDLKL